MDAVSALLSTMEAAVSSRLDPRDLDAFERQLKICRRMPQREMTPKAMDIAMIAEVLYESIRLNVLTEQSLLELQMCFNSLREMYSGDSL